MREASLAAVVTDGRGGRLKEVHGVWLEGRLWCCSFVAVRFLVAGGTAVRRYGGYSEGAAGQVPRGSSVVLLRGTTGWQVAVLGPLAAPRQGSSPGFTQTMCRAGTCTYHACTWAAGTHLLWRGLIIRSPTNMY